MFGLVNLVMIGLLVCHLGHFLVTGKYYDRRWRLQRPESFGEGVMLVVLELWVISMLPRIAIDRWSDPGHWKWAL